MDTQETNDFNFLRGKRINDMERLFQKRLDEIEQRHMDYFSKRLPKVQSDQHDRLHHHYNYYQSGDQASISWRDDSDLDQSIRNEVENVFKETFVP